MYKLIVVCMVTVCAFMVCSQDCTQADETLAPSLGEYHVAAYYWPAYHDEPRWRPFFRGTGPGGNEGEWEIIRKAKPKFDGHYQPRVPSWGYEDATDPKVMEKKIDAAVDHGVDIMIFDWYWYNNKPFLEDSINKGFLKAKNNDKISFYLMWANHDAPTSWDLDLSHEYKMIWPGSVDRSTFDTVVDRVIERYMKHPSYYKIDGKPVFSIYEMGTLIKGLGGVENTKKALDSFRQKVKQAGFPGLHLQAILWQVPSVQSTVPGDRTKTRNNTVVYLGFDSLTHYQWIHYARIPPNGDYSVWADTAMKEWESVSKDFSIPYFPHVSNGWDTNSRYKALQNTIKNQSPKAFGHALGKAKEFMDNRPLRPKLMTINSWNEWSEGSYLEPNEKFGMGNLEAVRKVFGEKASDNLK